MRQNNAQPWTVSRARRQGFTVNERLPHRVGSAAKRQWSQRGPPPHRTPRVTGLRGGEECGGTRWNAGPYLRARAHALLTKWISWSTGNSWYVWVSSTSASRRGISRLNTRAHTYDTTVARRRGVYRQNKVAPPTSTW